MKKEIPKDSEEWNIFTSVWRLYQQFGIPEENDEYWSDLLNVGCEIVKEHPSPLTERLVMAVMKALSDIAKEADK